VSGIYKIVNLTRGDFYVGSTINLRKRMARHFSDLKYQRHYNIHLQRAFNKYGKDNFKFEPLIFCNVENLELYEQIIIDGLCPTYNIRKDATSNIGLHISDEEKIRIGNFFRGKKLSKQHIINRDTSRTLSNIENNPMANIQMISSGKYRVLISQKHLGCFTYLEDAQLVRTSYFSRKFGGGL